MITWHARVYKLRNTALPPLTGPIGVSPEHAGALALSPHPHTCIYSSIGSICNPAREWVVEVGDQRAA